MELGDHTERWYTLAANADARTVIAASRGALIAQRHRLHHVDIDLISDEPWPDDVMWAVEAAKQTVEQRGYTRLTAWLVTKPSVTFRVDPCEDADFAVAVALAPFTISGTGLGERSRVIWSCKDTGTSAAFRLNGSEVVDVRAAIAAGAGDPRTLVQLV